MAAAEIRNETKCKKIGTQTLEGAANDTHEPPRREGPVISEQPERHPVAGNVHLAGRYIRSRGFAAASSGGLP